MGRPGSGRYTTYLPVNNSRFQRMVKLFKGGLSALYGNKTSNSEAAAVAVDTAKSVINGQGDVDIFGKGVDLGYGVNNGTVPNTTEVAWSKAGDPANPYVPDVSSPGPGKTEGTDKSVDPELSTTDFKPNFDPNNPSVNTTSPSATSKRIGTISLGEDLVGGKSSVE